MAWKHVSLPHVFSDGDPVEWFKRYDICCKANGWDDDARVAKLPTLLEGEALAIWSELSEQDQSAYSMARRRIKEKMAPIGFLSLSGFNQRKLQPGETLSIYLHELKRLLDQAMPNLASAMRNQLLCHQFINGIPAKTSRQLRASGEIDNLEKVLERTKLLMTLDGEEVAAVSQQTTSSESSRTKLPNSPTKWQLWGHRGILVTYPVVVQQHFAIGHFAIAVNSQGIFNVTVPVDVQAQSVTHATSRDT